MSSLLRRCYRGLLVVLPADFRRRNAAAMEEAFGEALEAAVSPLGLLRAAITAAGDVLAFAVLTRWRRFTARRSRTRSRSSKSSCGVW